jgi:hypothetical protein
MGKNEPQAHWRDEAHRARKRRIVGEKACQRASGAQGGVLVLSRRVDTLLSGPSDVNSNEKPRPGGRASRDQVVRYQAAIAVNLANAADMAAVRFWRASS